MADEIKWPALPSGWRYGTEEEAAGEAPPELGIGPESLQQNVGATFREFMGPRMPPESPSVTKDLLKPVGAKVFEALVPHTPKDVGIFAASLMFGGPLGPLARGAAKIAPKAVPALEALGSNWMRRAGGTALGGIFGASMGDQSSVLGGALQGIATSIGGEGVSKLTKWLRMNKQAQDLALEDPERLGEVVSQVLPGLPGLKSAKDFHAAFMKGGAQSAMSKAWKQGMAEVTAETQDVLVPSRVMSELRGPAKSVTLMNPALRGLTAFEAYGGAGTGQPGKYTVDDIAETIRRLRYQGWNDHEKIVHTLTAKDAREAADELQAELIAAIPPATAEKFLTVNHAYARGKRLEGFMEDKNLLDSKGMLNIPRLQQKLKQEGYPVGESLQIAADAAALENALFRGAGNLAEDVPAVAGKGLERLHWHFGLIPTMTSRLPQPGTYAGRPNYGVSPGDASQLVQMLKRGVTSDRPPISLARPDSESE